MFYCIFLNCAILSAFLSHLPSVSWKTKGVIKLKYLENKFLVLKIDELLKTSFVFKQHLFIMFIFSRGNLSSITYEFLLFKMCEDTGTSA